MTDFFSLLNEPRRPWVDTEALKAKFLVLSAEAHPDSFQNASPEIKAAAHERYTALNAAFAGLSETHHRLAHLLELETGNPGNDVRRIPSGTMDLFMDIGETCHSAGDFLARRVPTNSPALKGRRLAESLEWIDRLEKLQSCVDAKRDSLLGELRVLDKAWNAPGANRLPIERLEDMARTFRYLALWTAQLQERITQLSEI
jgi:hypothetical protein